MAEGGAKEDPSPVADEGKKADDAAIKEVTLVDGTKIEKKMADFNDKNKDGDDAA